VEIEKTMVVAASIDRLWPVLLDPKIMAGCVPGVQSVELVSDSEYLTDIKVKISFVSAHFKMRTTILETRPPHYLRCEGTGEDSSLASAVKQISEMFLTEHPAGGTQLRVKAKTEVFGRLGSFGLGVMRIKADRMWEEFGDNLSAVLRLPAQTGPIAPAGAPSGRDVAAEKPAHDAASAGTSLSGQPHPARAAAPVAEPARRKWWSWLTEHPRQGADAIREMRLPSDIYIEVHRGGDVIRVLWPSSASTEVTTWLKDTLSDTNATVT
jgi:uncharacterized protein